MLGEGVLSGFLTQGWEEPAGVRRPYHRACSLLFPFLSPSSRQNSQYDLGDTGFYEILDIFLVLGLIVINLIPKVREVTQYNMLLSLIRLQL